MAIRTDFSFIRLEDGVLAVSMSPPTNITNWNLQFTRLLFTSSTSAIVTKSAASGYASNQSGINLTSPTQGVFQVQINSADNSGDVRPYYHKVERLDSGFRSVLVEGIYLLR